MPMTLAVPNDLEARIRDRAAEQGIDANALVLRVLQESWELRPGAPQRVSSDEAALLRQLDLAFSDEQWAHYRGLVNKRRAEMITEDESAELIRLSDQLELANVRRLETVAAIARLRGRGFEDTMRDLKIGPVGGSYDE